jgi:hypothetical protein
LPRDKNKFLYFANTGDNIEESLKYIRDIIKEEIDKFLNKKIYYHGRKMSRPYRGTYIFIADSLGYASGYSDGKELHQYTIPFSEDKLFSINNKKHVGLLRDYVDDYIIKQIIDESGVGNEIDWGTLGYLSMDEFPNEEDLFQHLGFFGIRLKEREGIDSIYIFDESNLNFVGLLDITQPAIIKKIAKFYKDFTRGKNFLQ